MARFFSFFILVSLCLSTTLRAAPRPFFVQYDHRTNQIHFIDSESVWRQLYIIDLSTINNEDSLKDGKVFRGKIEGSGSDVYLNTTEGKKIDLVSIPEHWECKVGDTGEFLLLDNCHPKNCNFEYGAIVLSSLCRIVQMP